MSNTCADATQCVVCKKLLRTPEVLKFKTEHPERDHIYQYVRKPTVEIHVRKNLRRKEHPGSKREQGSKLKDVIAKVVASDRHPADNIGHDEDRNIRDQQCFDDRREERETAWTVISAH